MNADALKITESERPLSSDGSMHPQAEIWRLMHDHAVDRRADREASRRRFDEVHGRLSSLVVDLINVQHQLKAFVRNNGERFRGAGFDEQREILAALDEKLDRALARAGARALIPDGSAYAPEMDGWLDVLASVPSPGVEQAAVRDTVVPGVLLGTELVQRAQVVLAVPDSQPDPANE